MSDLKKYPRTRHLEGSKLQPGDEDLEQAPFREIAGRTVVVEEKLDGANAAISFEDDGSMLLQSRGHFLTGGWRERHFALFKTWAAAHQESLQRALGSRHVLYGEWLYAKHTIFYDALPHYFLEFDVLDRQAGAFLSTPRRRELLAGTSVVPVPVVFSGKPATREALEALIAPSLYKSSAWREKLDAAVREKNLDVERARRETDATDLAEGLYIKAEENDEVVARYKFVRAGFLQTVEKSEGHWLSRPIVPNALAPGVEIF